MNANILLEIIGSDYYTGVPDSLLNPLCDCIMKKYGTNPKHHIIAANEGNAVAIAAGYYLATGKIPVVYLQNSGEGNIINPLTSLLNKEVYGIPTVFLIGWRGEPGVHDEPQHKFQGKITLKLLEDIDVPYFIIDKNTSEQELNNKMEEFKQNLEAGRQVAFVIRKGALFNKEKIIYQNDYQMTREEVISYIVKYAENDPVVCTTGKASRELFEIREHLRMSHEHDFLTVGSMGHASSIALGIALQKPDQRIWCIDGDGAALMHMGALAVIGSIAPKNLVHIVINNGAHESVGGMPTVMHKINIADLAMKCGYRFCYQILDEEDIDAKLKEVKNNRELSFVEICTRVFSRNNLGRPTNSQIDNMRLFKNALEK